MRPKKVTFFLVVTVATIVAALLGARTAPESPSSVDLARRLAGKRWQDDQSALSILWARRGRLAEELIREAGSSRAATRCSAIYLIGLYRIARATPVLAANIQFRQMFKNSMIQVRGTSPYPAMHALIRIGTPAIPSMVKNLTATARPDVAACSAWVIRKVEGRRLGACVIKLALHKATSLLEKDRLRAALACVGSKDWKWDYWSPIALPEGVKWPVGNVIHKRTLKNK